MFTLELEILHEMMVCINDIFCPKGGTLLGEGCSVIDILSIAYHRTQISFVYGVKMYKL